MHSERRRTEPAGRRLRHAMLSALVLHGLVVFLGPPLLLQRPVIREWRPQLRTRLIEIEDETILKRYKYSPEPIRPDIPGPKSTVIEVTDEPQLPDIPPLVPLEPHFAGLSGGEASRFTMAQESSPQPIIMVDPEYPSMARAAEAEGTVRVRAVVDEFGFVVDVAIDSSDTIGLLENAALNAAKKWRFRPAKQGNVPVQVIVIIPFTFRM